MIREILQHPDERLRLRAFPVLEGTPAAELAEAIRDLTDTFAATQNCYGLAATQLGIPLRIIVVDLTPSRCDTLLMVNPVLGETSGDTQRVQDACMSVKHGQEFGFTRRPKRIAMRWLDADGQERRRKFSGLIAACLHHEVDHLDGVLFLDRVQTVYPGWGAL